MGKILDQQKAAAGVLIGNDHKLQKLVSCGNFDRLTLELTGLLAAPPGFHKLVVANDFDNAMVEGIGKLKEPACGWVGELDQSMGIGNEHAIGDLVEDGGETRTL
jgi:hypothetical protein